MLRRSVPFSSIGLACLAIAASAPGAGAQSAYVGDLPLSASPATAAPDLNNSSGILPLTGAHIFGTVSNAAGAAVVNEGATTGEVIANGGVITNSPKATWNGNLDIGANVAGAEVVNQGTWSGVLNNAGGDLDNSGAAVAVVNQSGNFVNNGTVAKSVANAGQFTNSGVIAGAVDNTSVLVNNGSGKIDGGFTNTGNATNDGLIAGGVVQSGSFVNNASGIVRGGLTNSGGSSVNGGLVFGGAAVAAGALSNNGTVAGGATVSGPTALFVNNGSVSGAVAVTDGSFINNNVGVVAGSIISAATLSNAGVIQGGVTSSGTFTNLAAGSVYNGVTQTSGQTVNNGNVYGGGMILGGSTVNNGSISGALGIGTAGAVTNNRAIDGAIGNAGLFVNNADGVVTKALDNLGTAINSGAIVGAVENSGAFVNNASGQIAGGLAISGGSAKNAGLVNGGVSVRGGELTSSGAILGGLTNTGTVHATGTIGGAIVNQGALIVGDSGSTGEKLTIVPGSTLTGEITIPVDFSTGKSNFLAASGVSLAGASVAFSAALANARTYWGAIAYSDVAIALSDSALATLKAASGPLYAYSDPSGLAIVQTINPGLGATAAHHAAATLQALDATLLEGPSDFLRAPADLAPNLTAAHVWSRGLGADLAFSGSNVGGTGLSFGQTQFVTRLAGAEFGIEQGLYNIENSGLSLHLGLVGGEAGASSSDRNLPGATAATAFPFIGGYAALAGDGFTALFETRYNHLDMSVTNPALDVVNQAQSAAGMTYAGKLSYHLPLAGGFYLEPSASLIYSRLAVADETTNVGVLSFGKQQTTLARVGLRAGADFETDSISWSPYVLAIYDYERRSGATISVPSGPKFEMTGVGGFGEFGLGLGASFPKVGLTAYLQGERQVGVNVSGLVATAGLKFSF